jgi:hypothetical protein
MRVKMVAHKDLGEDHQLFLPKHLLLTVVGIVFLERNMDFHQPVCAGSAVLPHSYHISLRK